MFASPTTDRSGSRSIEVLLGESQSDASRYVTAGGPPPTSDPCADHPVAAGFAGA